MKHSRSHSRRVRVGPLTLALILAFAMQASADESSGAPRSLNASSSSSSSGGSSPPPAAAWWDAAATLGIDASTLWRK